MLCLRSGIYRFGSCPHRVEGSGTRVFVGVLDYGQSNTSQGLGEYTRKWGQGWTMEVPG